MNAELTAKQIARIERIRAERAVAKHNIHYRRQCVGCGDTPCIKPTDPMDSPLCHSCDKVWAQINVDGNARAAKKDATIAAPYGYTKTGRIRVKPLKSQTHNVCEDCGEKFDNEGWLPLKYCECCDDQRRSDEEESEVKPTFKYHLSYEDADLDTESFVDLETARVAMKAVIGKGQYSWVQIIEGFDAVVEEWESASVETDPDEE